MRARPSRERSGPRAEREAVPRRSSTAGRLQALGSQAGNRAVASLLAVQREGATPQAEARRLMPGGRPRELQNLALTVTYFGLMAAQRFAQWAPASLADKDTAIEVGAYLTDIRARPKRLEWALETASGDAALLRELIGVIAERHELATVEWAWQYAGKSVAQLEAVLDYHRTHRQAGAKVLDIAVKVLEDVGGDVAAATAEMSSLAAYDFDAGLRTWAAGQATALATEEVEELKRTADETRKQKDPGTDTPHKGSKLAKWKVKENQTTKLSNAVERGKLDQARDQEVAAADASLPARTDAARTAMEDFLARSRASGLDPADSAWLLQRAEGRPDLAAALRPLFGPSDEGRQATDWALTVSRKPQDVQRLVQGLLHARGAALGEQPARTVLALDGWLALPDLTARTLSAALAASGAALAPAVAWLTAASPLNESVRLLVRWHERSGDLDQLLDLAAKKPFADLVWYVEHIGDAASTRAADALHGVLARGTSRQDLERVLPYLSPEQAEQVLDRVAPQGGPLDPQLVPVLRVVTAEQAVRWLAPLKHELRHVHEWVVVKQWTGAALDPVLRWSAPVYLPVLLKRDDPATLTQLQAHPAHYLYSLRQLIEGEIEVAKYGPSLVLVVGADAEKKSWNKGTFQDPLHSVVYHYCKHVRNINLNVSVADYTQDALDLWAVHGPGVKHNGGKKVRVGPTRGGLYTTAGVPYSFWY